MLRSNFLKAALCLIYLLILPSILNAITTPFSFTRLTYETTGYTVSNMTASGVSLQIVFTKNTHAYTFYYQPGLLLTTGDPALAWPSSAGVFYGGLPSFNGIVTCCNSTQLSALGLTATSTAKLKVGIMYVTYPVPPNMGLPLIEVLVRNGKVISLEDPLTPSFLTEKGKLGAKKLNKSEFKIGDPVDLTTGAFYEEDTDLVLPGAYPIVWTRRYSSDDTINAGLGLGWRSNHLSFLEVQGAELKLSDQNGNILGFTASPTTPDLWILSLSNNPDLQHTPTSQIIHSTLTKTIEAGTTVYTYINSASGETSRYEVTSFPLALTSTESLSRERPYLVKKSDSSGNYITYTYETNPTNNGYGEIKTITSNSGESIQLNYNTDNNITQVVSSDSRTVNYTYTTNNFSQITESTLPSGLLIKYTYSSGVLFNIQKPGNRTLTNFTTAGKVTEQKTSLTTSSPLTTNATFVYTPGKTTAANVHGHKSEHEYANGKLNKVVDRNGQTTLYEWYSSTDPLLGSYENALYKVTNPRGTTTTYQYSETGQPTTVTLEH